MRKPTKQEKDALIATADTLKGDLEVTGFTAPTADIDPTDDNRIVYTIDDPTLPGAKLMYVTYVVGPPHPETGEAVTAKQMIDDGSTKKRLEDMAVRRAYVNKPAEMLAFVLAGAVVPTEK